MKKVAEVMQERASKIDEQGALIDLRATENRDFTDEEVTLFETLEREISNLDVQIERLKKEDEALKRRAALDKPDSAGEKKEKKEVQKRFSIKRAIEMQLRGRDLDGVEKEISDEAIREKKQSLGTSDFETRGIHIPGFMAFGEARATGQTVTEDAGGFGGALVQEVGGEIVAPFLSGMKIQDLGVRVLNGLAGNYPLISFNELTFQNLGETAAIVAQKTAITKRALTPKRKGGEVWLSNQLLAQSAFNVDSEIRRLLTNAMDKKMFEDMINGDGIAPNPLGILNDTVAFDNPLAIAAAFTLARALKLRTSVEEQNAPAVNRAFLMHPTLAGILESTTIDAGSGQFLIGENGTLRGEKVFKSSFLPTFLNGADPDSMPVIYGDWNEIVAGFWGGVSILVDPFTQAGSNSVRLILNAHADVLAANPKAFAVDKKVTFA